MSETLSNAFDINISKKLESYVLGALDARRVTASTFAITVINTRISAGWIDRNMCRSFMVNGSCQFPRGVGRVTTRIKHKLWRIELR